MAFKKQIALAICLLSLLIVNRACTRGDDKSALVLAKIGSRTISVKEYEENLKRFMPEVPPEDGDVIAGLKRDLLQQMIEENLIMEEATKRNIIITNEELGAEVERLEKEFGKSSFEDTIKDRYGKIKTWKEEIRKKLLIKKTIDTAIGAKVVPTDQETRKYYDDHIKDFEYPETVRARMIVVSSEDDAQKIRKTLTPENFAGVAKKSSLSPEKEKGGDLGYFSSDEMPKEFVDVVFSLKIGQISNVLKTSYGYHIFLLDARKKGGRHSYYEVYEKIVDKMRSENSDTQFELWMNGLKEKTPIEVNEALL